MSGAVATPTAEKTFDPASGNYIITYTGDDGGLYTRTFEPGNKISPVVVSSFSRAADGATTYTLKVENSALSVQDVRGLSLPVSDLISSPSLIKRCDDSRNSRDNLRAAKKAAKASVGAVAPWRPVVLITNPSACRTASTAVFEYAVDWAHFDETVPTKLRPGQSQAGFSVRSGDLPGVVSARLLGHYDLDANRFPANGSGNEALKEIYESLTNDVALFSVVRFAAAPTFAVPSPFDAPPLLDSIRSHVQTWPQQGLMDTSLWQKIDALLVEASAKIRAGSSAEGVLALNRIRLELRMKYPDLDATSLLDDPRISDLPGLPAAMQAFLSAHDRRLAAKVLDLDVAYVADRVSPAVRAPSQASATVEYASPPSCDDVKFTMWGPNSSPAWAKCKLTIREEGNYGDDRYVYATGLAPESPGVTQGGASLPVYLRICDAQDRCNTSNNPGGVWLWANFTKRSPAEAVSEFERFDATFDVFLCGDPECSTAPAAGRVKAGVAFLNIYVSSMTDPGSPDHKVKTSAESSSR